MGEIADMMLDGTMCQVCGVWLEQEPVGYPVTCAGCIAAGDDPTQHNLDVNAKPPRTVECPEAGCERKFRTRDAAAQHWRDKHD